jgi:hypothetical protein
MATGYEVGMYADIRRIREALERIAKVLEDQVIALPPDLSHEIQGGEG